MQLGQAQVVLQADMRTSKYHNSLNFEPKIMGVIHKFFILECSIFFTIIILKIYIFLIFTPIIHFFLRWISSQDFDSLQIYKKYMNEVDFWDPWIHFQEIKKREKGYGQGLLK
jgi:hypothetical protein